MLINRKRLFSVIGVSSFVAACLFFAVRSKGLHCQAIQVDGGYGYVVLNGKDTLILQPYIPAIGKKVAFATKEDALEIGQLVCRKLASKQSPALSKEEVEKARRGTFCAFPFGYE